MPDIHLALYSVYIYYIYERDNDEIYKIFVLAHYYAVKVTYCLRFFLKKCNALIDKNTHMGFKMKSMTFPVEKWNQIAWNFSFQKICPKMVIFAQNFGFGEPVDNVIE